MRKHASHKPYATAVRIKLFSFRKKGLTNWLAIVGLFG